MTNCGSGTATVNVTLYDTPPTGVSLLSFSLPIVGISLTPSTGSDVSIYSPTTVVPIELTRLQTDSTSIVSQASVAAGNYTAVKITVAASSGVFINTSGSTITWSTGSCAANGAVCDLPNGAATTITVPLTVTLSNNVTQWIGLNVNLNNAIVTTGGIGVDFSQANVFTATTTVRTGLASGVVDTIEDFTGSVTAATSSSITVKSSITGQSITAAIGSTTELDAAPQAYSGCSQPTSSAVCIATGSIVSLDASLSNTGKYTATEIDVLDVATADEVEGVIYPTTAAGVVGLILADKTSASSNAILGASTTTYGTGIFLNIASANIDGVDPKTLTPILTNPVLGFTGSSDLVAGQVVRAQVSNITSDSAGIHATATNIILRFSRISGAVNTIASPTFTLTGIPNYINSFNPGMTLTPPAFTSPSVTIFDGVTGITDSKFVVGGPVAIRALFLNPSLAQYPFLAAKVRVP
ncbi:MAG: DUF4382 domain-containing protein [Candidatus Acidiferrum sp.]